MSRPGPVERVRRRLAGTMTPAQIGRIPDGYQRLGSVLLVKLPESLRPSFGEIASAYREELGVDTVLRRRGPIGGEFRLPDVETLLGGSTETEVRENGIVYRFDAARVMFAAGNRAERERVGRLVRPGEAVADLFAGIGYFTLPAAVHGRAGRVVACEANPVSFSYLQENVRTNRVGDRVTPVLGPNEAADLPLGAFDRVLLGLLPSAVGWTPRAIGLVRPTGGWLHVHVVVGSRDGVGSAEAAVRKVAGDRGRSVRGREVKPYGPGRVHVVVDVDVGPVPGPASPIG